jgi:hypothetical protein
MVCLTYSRLITKSAQVISHHCQDETLLMEIETVCEMLNCNSVLTLLIA